MNTKTANRAVASSRRSRPPFWRSPMTWVLALILAAGTVAVVLAANDGNDAPSGSGAETAFAETLGAPLPPFAEPDPAIGRPAPTISAQTLLGERVQITDDGIARLYGFFAHWCPHCQNELPRTTAWLQSHTLPAGVEVIAVSTAVDSTEGNYPPSDWFAREEWPASVLLDDAGSPLAADFGLTAFPFWVAVDSDGTVVARATGALSDNQFVAMIEEITPAD